MRYHDTILRSVEIVLEIFGTEDDAMIVHDYYEPIINNLYLILTYNEPRKS